MCVHCMYMKVRASVEESVRSAVVQQWEVRLRETEHQHHSQLETLQNTHTVQLTYALCIQYCIYHVCSGILGGNDDQSL